MIINLIFSIILQYSQFLKLLSGLPKTRFSDVKMELGILEKKILSAIQYGMPMSLTPYQDLADKIGVTSEQLLNMLRNWKADKRIRRLGAIVNHFQMGH